MNTKETVKMSDNCVEKLRSCFGVFWDIENCPIPTGRLASDVVESMRTFIKHKYPHCLTECTFCCACDTRRLDERIVEGLNRCGVDILHVNACRVPFKVDADAKLKEVMQKFVEHHNSDTFIFLITGDIDFAPALRSAKRHGNKVILFYGLNFSRDLRNFATESHFYNEMIANDQSVVRNNVVTAQASNAIAIRGRTVEIAGNTTMRSVNSNTSPNERQRYAIRIPLSNNGISHAITAPTRTSVTQSSNEIQTPEASVRDESLSQEYLAKIETIQEVTFLERDVAIRLLKQFSGNLEEALDTVLQ